MTTQVYATFAKGDKVRAIMNTRHLFAGEIYHIEKVLTEGREPYQYVYYVSDADRAMYPVKNAHIVLEGVK